MEDNKSADSKYNVLSLIALVLTTVLWGTTFILTKLLTQQIPIFFYLGLRYLIAIIGFTPFFLHFKKINKKIILAGVFTGFIYFLSMIFQTYGLQTTTAGKAGFITGLSTIMVPFIAWLIYKDKLNYRVWIGASLSVVGMALLLLEGVSGIIIGDLLVLGHAVLYALFIIFNDKSVGIHDVYLYSIIQLITLTGLSFTTSLIIGETYNLSDFNLNIWLILIYLGLGATALTFLFQNWGQKYQNASRTAIIFALEPVFAALFGFLIGQETFTLFNWIGASLILTAILITVIKNSSKKEIEIKKTEK